MSKILRSFVVFLSVLLVITACIGTVVAAEPEYSIGFGPLPVIDPEPNLLISARSQYVNGQMGWGYSLDPVFTPNLLTDVVQYFDDSFLYERSSGSDIAGFVNGAYYYKESQSDVLLDGDNLSGYVTFDFEANFQFNYIESYDYLLSISYGNFYSWGDDYGNYSFECGLAFRLNQLATLSDLEFQEIQIYYSEAGSSEVKTLIVDEDGEGSSDFNRLIFNISPVLLGNGFSNALFYIHRVNIVLLSTSVPDLNLAGTMTYTFVPGLREAELRAVTPFDPDQNPALPLVSYTQFLGNAASGFLDLQIFPGFTLGGVLMTFLAFSLVVWFLKVFAGG